MSGNDRFRLPNKSSFFIFCWDDRQKGPLESPHLPLASAPDVKKSRVSVPMSSYQVVPVIIVVS